MIEDAASAVEFLRAVLTWLDHQDLPRVAIDVDSAIARLDAAASANMIAPNANQRTVLH